MTESRVALTERVLLAIRDAVEIGGLSHEDAAIITATVAADFARVAIGESYVAELVDIMRHRAATPLPSADEPDLFKHGIAPP